MSSSNKIWETLGELDPEDFQHLIHNLFVIYEEMLQNDPENQEALKFFDRLQAAIDKTDSCNANRR